MKLVIVENPRPLTFEHYNDVANAPLSASLNCGYALAVARRAGWDTAYLDFTVSCEDGQTMAERVLAENGDMILLHWVYAWGREEIVTALLDRLVRASGAAIGAFGLFPTLAHVLLARYAPQLDFIMVGEFEDTLAELLPRYADKSRIAPFPGLFAGTFPALRREPVDLAQLPVPDDVGANCNYSSMNIAASRGCYGACSFCFVSSYYGCAKRRERSPGSLEQELDIRMERRNAGHVYFVDPTFIGPGEGSRERVRQICTILKERGITFGFETRVDTLDEELIGILAEHGATSLFLGIESGCDAVLRRIRKNVTKEQNASAVRAVRKSGIGLSAGFIMFEPDTTLEELSGNYGFLEELGLLQHHDQTVNMLYHSQIVLFGSTAWNRFKGAGRLHMDERLPFEARYEFSSGWVGRVCNAMKHLSTEYFIRMDRFCRESGVSKAEQHECGHSGHLQRIDGESLNRILKDAFISFVKHACMEDGKRIEEAKHMYADELNGCFTSSQ